MAHSGGPLCQLIPFISNRFFTLERKHRVDSDEVASFSFVFSISKLVFPFPHSAPGLYETCVLSEWQHCKLV